MPRLTKSELIGAGMFALLAVHDIRFRIKANRAARAYLASHKGYEEVCAAHFAQINYLCRLLEENDVFIDEFDLIALNFNNK